MLFVGRITHQKGITHLLAAARYLDPSAQLVLRAGPADTPELARQVAVQIRTLAAQRDGVRWVEESLDHRQLNQLLSHATVSCCPSVYSRSDWSTWKPWRVRHRWLASTVGGIPEIIEDEITGKLVPFEPVSLECERPGGTGTVRPRSTSAINELVVDPHLARKMGEAGRRRVIQSFSWPEAARLIVELYRGLEG